MINYPFDLQQSTDVSDDALVKYRHFLKTADFEEKIAMLSFLLHHKDKFVKNELQQLLKEAYTVSYGINLAYNTLVENYFLEGKSGVLFLFFQLEAFLEDVSYAEVIDNFLKAIVFQLRFSPVLCHHDGNQQQSPVGFSKGNSGIAYSLVILAAYFNNKDIALLSEGLLRFEDDQLENNHYHTYQSPAQNVTALEQLKVKYRQKDTAFFTDREQVLTSQEALQMFYTRIELMRVLAKTPNVNVLEILVQKIAVDTTLQSEYQWCVAVVEALQTKVAYASLPSLDFTFPIKIASKTTNDFTFDGFVLQQVTMAFRRTIILFNTLEIGVLETFKEKHSPKKHATANFFQLFHKHCKTAIQTQQLKHQGCLSEILDFEYETVVMQQEVSNYLHLQLEDIINVSRRETFLATADEVFFATELHTNPSGKIVKTSWNWVTEEIFERVFNSEVNLEAESGEFYCYKIPLGVMNLEKKSNIKEVLLSEYEYILLDLFEFPVAVEDVIKEFSTIFDVETKEDFQRVRNFAKEIIKTLVFKKCLRL